jgi:flagellar basal body rod protein FlgF
MQLSAVSVAGLDRAQCRLEQTASRLGRIAGTGDPVAVDLATEMVNLLSAKQEFAVDIKVLKVADQIERRAVDLLG